MRPHALLAALALALPAAPCPAAGDDFMAGPVIARGKGVEIRRGQLDDAFIAFRANLAARGQVLPEMRREGAEAQLLERMIVTQLLVNKAADEDRIRAKTNSVKFFNESRRNANSEAAFERHLKSLGLTLAQFTNRVMEQALSEEVVTRELKNKITVPEADAKKFYETNGEAFTQPEIARASHILLATRDEKTGLPVNVEQKLGKRERAHKALERAKKDEDFAKLAAEFSEDPSVKENKGEYKFTRAKDDARRAMVPEFEKAAFALKPGQISELVTTDYGYHIIKLHEITPARKADFAEVRERINEVLKQVELEKQMPDYFAALKKEAAVEVLDEKLRAAIEKAAQTGAPR
jgi:peptidyl-prolyl cis-trans isomerase C